MLLSDILKSVHDKKEYRPSKNDSNFNYVHIEYVLDLVRLAYNEGRNSLKTAERNDNTDSQKCLCETPGFLMTGTCGNCGGVIPDDKF